MALPRYTGVLDTRPMKADNPYDPLLVLGLRSPYLGFVPLAEGDRLVVHNRTLFDTPLFDGKVELDYLSDARTILNGRISGNLLEYPADLRRGGHVLLHALIKGVDGDDLLRWIENRHHVTVTCCPRLVRPEEHKVSGNLDPFHEMGMEGNVMWSIHDRLKHSYDGLVALHNNQPLTVFEPDGETVLWQGRIGIRSGYQLPRMKGLHRKKVEEAFSCRFPAIADLNFVHTST